MLDGNQMIGFVTTSNAARARAFYERTLGFRFVSEDQFALVVDTGKNQIRISPVPAVTPVPHTVLGWEVTAIEKTAAALAERGVAFVRYDWAKQDALGIWTAPGGDRVAWFKDPDGNLLSISQHAR